MNLYFKGKYEEARDIFLKFLKKYKHSKYYDNALFWIGQTYFVEKNYGEAIKYFENLIIMCDNHKLADCNKYISALYKLGESYINSGDVDKGVEILKKVIKNYPDSEEAELAVNTLKSLGLKD